MVIEAIANSSTLPYTAVIQDIVMSQKYRAGNTGSEGEETHVRTSDAQSHCRLVG